LPYEFTPTSSCSATRPDSGLCPCLPGIDATRFEPLIDPGLRANDAKTGAELGCEYGESFRYQRIELPEIFQS